MIDTWILIAIIFAAGLVAGITGFGSGLVGMGILATLMTVTEATVIMNIVAIFIYSLNLWTVRRDLLWRETWPILVTGLPSILLGIYLLKHLNADILRAGVAVAILAGCAIMLWSPQKTLTRKAWPWAYVAGLLGGILSGALGTGGPPVVLYALSRGWEKPTTKSVLSAYFLIMVLWRMVALVVVGVSTRETVTLGLLLIIPATVASYLGTRIFRRMSNRMFRYAALLLLLGLAAKLLLT